MSGRYEADTRPGNVLLLIGVVVSAGYVGLLMYGVAHWTYDSYGGLLLYPLLLGVGTPLVVRLGRRQPELGVRLLVAAFVLKLTSGGARYLQSYEVGGGADAERYHDAGVEIAYALLHGRDWHTQGPFPGTAFLEGLTGYVYVLIGSTRLGGYFFFSFLGFWGLLMFVQAFRTALPDADVRRYAQLVLFLPSLLFWPSSPGKETWMMLVLGLSCLGAARMLTHRRGGFVLLALGIGGACLIRPHMGALVLAGVFVAYLVRPSKPGAGLSRLGKVVGLGVMLVLGAVVVAQAERFFGGGVTEAFDKTTAATSQGGSAFEAQPVRSPADLPMGFITVIFRPFPYEAHSLQSLVASAEGLLLMGLMALSWRRLRALPALLRSHPYTAFALTYTLLFVVAFSSFANFGILTRQRVQVFPFFLVLLALPLVAAPARQERVRHARHAVRVPVVAAASRSAG